MYVCVCMKGKMNAREDKGIVCTGFCAEKKTKVNRQRRF